MWHLLGSILLPVCLTSGFNGVRLLECANPPSRLTSKTETTEAKGTISLMEPGHKVSDATPLDWTLGDWKGHRTDSKSGTAFPITIQVHSVLGGSGITEEMEVVHGSDVYRAFTITAFEKDRKLWMMHYLNQPTGESIPMEGTIESKSSTWMSINPNRARESKLVYEHFGKAGWKRTQYVSEDAGKTWFTVFTDVLERS